MLFVRVGKVAKEKGVGTIPFRKVEENLNRLKSKETQSKDGGEGVDDRDVQTSNRRVSSSTTRKGVVPLVLISTGSFSPPHRMHVHMMDVVKRHIEESTCYYVVGGYLSPSHHRYVNAKLGRDAVPASVRIKLCAACTADSPYLACSSWEAELPMFLDYGDVVTHHQEVLQRLYPSVQLVYVCGQDHAEKCNFFCLPRCGMCVVLRDELDLTSPDVERLREKLQKQVKGPIWIVSPNIADDNNSIFSTLTSSSSSPPSPSPFSSSSSSHIPTAAATTIYANQVRTIDILQASSTKVRELSKRKDEAELRKFCHPAVVDYYKEQWQNAS